MAAPSRRKRLSGDFVQDSESFGRFMLSDQASAPVMQITHLIAETARSTAPRGEDRRAGEEPRAKTFAQGFEVHDIVLPMIGDPPGPRRAGEITNDAESAVYAEFGTGRQRGHRTLRKAGEPWHDPKAVRGK